MQRSAGFAQFSCFTHLLRFPRGVVSSDVTCSVLAFPATGRLFLPKVSFKCIAKRCRLLTFDSRSLHKAIEEGGLAEVPWMFFFDVFLCDRKRIKQSENRKLKVRLYDCMTACVSLYLCLGFRQTLWNQRQVNKICHFSQRPFLRLPPEQKSLIFGES